MRILSTDPQARSVQIFYWPIKGCSRYQMHWATGFDSDEKWIEFIPHTQNPADKTKYRIMTADGSSVKARAFIDYDVVDATTGNTIIEVRQ